MPCLRCSDRAANSKGRVLRIDAWDRNIDSYPYDRCVNLVSYTRAKTKEGKFLSIDLRRGIGKRSVRLFFVDVM